MNPVINTPPQPGNEATVAIDLSGQIRNTAFIVAIVASLICLVAFAYRPATTDEDIFQATYSSSIARVLVQRHGKRITEIFQANDATFDTPYDSYAKNYLRTLNEDIRTTSLLHFLNLKKDVQRQYLLLLVEDPSIRGSLSEYVRDTKTRWETFTLPVLEVKICRVCVLFYLTLAFSTLHGYYIIKHRYLLNIRAAFPSLRFLPDPSLLTATGVDLQVLNKFLRLLVCFLQEAMLWILPFSVCLVMLIYWLNLSNASHFDFVEVIIAFVFSLGEAVVAASVQVNYIQAKRAQWKDLFGTI